MLRRNANTNKSSFFYEMCYGVMMTKLLHRKVLELTTIDNNTGLNEHDDSKSVKILDLLKIKFLPSLNPSTMLIPHQQATHPQPRSLQIPLFLKTDGPEKSTLS
nr:hypothetical protein [Tanacetum cinerariifolium]